MLCAETQPAPAFKELTDKVEGRASRAPGGFPGRVSGTTGLGRGPNGSPRSDSEARQGR